MIRSSLKSWSMPLTPDFGDCGWVMLVWVSKGGYGFWNETGFCCWRWCVVSILLVIVYAIVLEEHGFGAWITVCEWYYWCFSLVHSTLQTLIMRTLASMFCSTIEVSALVHTGTSYFQMRISVLHHSFTQPPWPIMLIWERMRLRVCTCLGYLFPCCGAWVVTVPNTWALSLCSVNEVVVINQSLQ